MYSEVLSCGLLNLCDKGVTLANIWICALCVTASILHHSNGLFYWGRTKRTKQWICQKINNKRVLEVHLQMPVCTSFSVCKRSNNLNGLLLQKRRLNLEQIMIET